MAQPTIQKKRSYSLPKLANFAPRQPRLFNTEDQLLRTKQIFLERFEVKDENKNIVDQSEKPIPNRSLIQFPKYNTQEGFIAFKTINKNQTEHIFSQMKKMKSKSTLLPPYVKAQILFNKHEYEKIVKASELKLNRQREFVAKRIKDLTPAEINKQKIRTNSKIKKQIKKVRKIMLRMNMREYEHNLYCWKPYIDYDAMAVAIREEIFFIGGRKQTPPVVYSCIQSSWKEMQVTERVKCFGQTNPSVIDNKKILCFGGFNYFQIGFSQITNSLKTVDIKTMHVSIQEFNEARIPYRAYHSQCVYGKFLIVSGGSDKNNRLFNNFTIFNYQKKYWSELTIKYVPEELKQGFSKHETLPIFHHRYNYSIYNADPIIEKDQNISQQGVYIFGGEDANGELFSKLYILKLGQPILSIEPLKTFGAGPVARKNTKMIKHKEYLIIHGGRNDSMKPQVLNYIDFLNLKTLSWIKVGGQKPPYRYSHALSVVNDEVVIMGGKGLEGLSKEVFLMPYQEIIQTV